MICAELSDKIKFSELYETVTTCMLHESCESVNANASCMRNDKCSKGYSKEYMEETWINSNDYFIYRRRDNGDSFQKNSYVFTNRDVVPYNSQLSQKFNCHINVEIVTSIMTVKYLYKYVYKDHDHTAVFIQRERGETIDEVQNYLNARYVSASEAC